MRDVSNWGKSQPGSWGYGGAFYTDDGGDTWKEDALNPTFQANLNGVAIDPVDHCKLWYATAGGGLMLGLAPPGLPGC